MVQDVLVPDIGDYKDVPVIDILVKPGDRVEAEAPLVTLESDKATMDVPPPAAGVVKEIKVKVGDKVSDGSVPFMIDAAAASAGAAASDVGPRASAAASDLGPQASGEARKAPAAAFDVLGLGSGPGGYAAAFRAADLGQRVALVGGYPVLCCVCLTVGCIPSQSLR